MATQQSDRRRSGLTDRLFFEHPRSLGMTWAGHGVGAVAIGAKLVGAGAACLVHAVVPGFFTQTAGRTVTGMYDHMRRRKAGAANPENWPDYEI
ncbi:MAG: DUF6356 family protein [Sphingomicrobium sp.]